MAELDNLHRDPLRRGQEGESDQGVASIVGRGGAEVAGHREPLASGQGVVDVAQVDAQPPHFAGPHQPVAVVDLNHQFHLLDSNQMIFNWPIDSILILSGWWLWACGSGAGVRRCTGTAGGGSGGCAERRRGPGRRDAAPGASWNCDAPDAASPKDRTRPCTSWRANLRRAATQQQGSDGDSCRILAGFLQDSCRILWDPASAAPMRPDPSFSMPADSINVEADETGSNFTGLNVGIHTRTMGLRAQITIIQSQHDAPPPTPFSPHPLHPTTPGLLCGNRWEVLWEGGGREVEGRVCVCVWVCLAYVPQRYSCP